MWQPILRLEFREEEGWYIVFSNYGDADVEFFQRITINVGARNDYYIMEAQPVVVFSINELVSKEVNFPP